MGGALGFGLGAVVGSAASWRVAFIVCGLPGVVAAWSCARLNDPPRGGLDPPLSQSKEGSDALSQSKDGSFDLQMTTTTAQTAEGSAAELAGDVIEEPDTVSPAGTHRRSERIPCADQSIEMQPLQKPETPLPRRARREAESIVPASSSASSPLSSIRIPTPNASPTLATSSVQEPTAEWRDDAWQIISNPYYVCAVLGLAANNFAMGGLADFYPSFASRCLGASVG